MIFIGFLVYIKDESFVWDELQKKSIAFKPTSDH